MSAGLENQRNSVVAVALACGARSIVENVPLVTTATAAMVFRAGNNQLEIKPRTNGIRNVVVKAWPAGFTIEFRGRSKQRQSAASASVDPLPLFIV